jgi:hypothetical protein
VTHLYGGDKSNGDCELVQLMCKHDNEIPIRRIEQYVLNCLAGKNSYKQKPNIT